MNDNKKSFKSIFSIQNLEYVSTMGILFLVLGLIISTQSKKHAELQMAQLPVERQLNGMVALLKETQNKKADLETEFTKLKNQVRMMNNTSSSEDITNRQLKSLYQIAGLTPMNGEGVVIKLNDEQPNKNISSSELMSNDGLVHSEDLLKLINELKAAGAKAIAINNQRLVTTSEIVTAGNNILVNQAKLSPPYVIKAIGETNTMSSALKIRGGIMEYLEVYGIKVTIEKKDNVSIPAYKDSAYS
jgi:uncharacterized protein YlxW (UPF0749 family)